MKSLTAMWKVKYPNSIYPKGHSLTQYKMTAKTQDIGEIIGQTRIVTDEQFEEIGICIDKNREKPEA